MSIFDYSAAGASADEWLAPMQEHILRAEDPNETGEDGRTLLFLAIVPVD